MTNYRYSEQGYVSDVQCIHNQSSNLSFVDLGGTDYVRALQAVGSLPTGGWTHGFIMGSPDDSMAFALAAQANDTNYLYGLISGINYQHLNNTQCEVTFSPMLFDVNVDNIAQNITVTPIPLANTSV